MDATPRHRAKQRLDAWMKATKTTQEALGKTLGRTQGWVSKNLLGAGPRIEHLDDLARITGHDPGDFVTLKPVAFSVQPQPTSGTNLARATDPAGTSADAETKPREVNAEMDHALGFLVRTLLETEQERKAFITDFTHLIQRWQAEHGGRESAKSGLP